MSIPSSDVESTLVFLVVIGLFYARRVVLSVTGTPVSSGRLVAYSVLVGLLFAFAVSTGFASVPWYVFPALVVAGGAAYAVAEPYVRREVVVEERAPGRWYYRLSPLVPLVYLTLFVVRLLLDLFVLGIDPFVYSFAPLTLAPAEVGVLIAIDLLFAVSTGLLFGRNVAIYRAYTQKVGTANRPLPAG